MTFLPLRGKLNENRNERQKLPQAVFSPRDSDSEIALNGLLENLMCYMRVKIKRIFRFRPESMHLLYANHPILCKEICRQSDSFQSVYRYVVEENTKKANERAYMFVFLRMQCMFTVEGWTKI